MKVSRKDVEVVKIFAKIDDPIVKDAVDVMRKHCRLPGGIEVSYTGDTRMSLWIKSGDLAGEVQVNVRNLKINGLDSDTLNSDWRLDILRYLLLLGCNRKCVILSNLNEHSYEDAIMDQFESKISEVDAHNLVMFTVPIKTALNINTVINGFCDLCGVSRKQYEYAINRNSICSAFTRFVDGYFEFRNKQFKTEDIYRIPKFGLYGNDIQNIDSTTFGDLFYICIDSGLSKSIISEDYYIVPLFKATDKISDAYNKYMKRIIYGHDETEKNKKVSVNTEAIFKYSSSMCLDVLNDDFIKVYTLQTLKDSNFRQIINCICKLEPFMIKCDYFNEWYKRHYDKLSGLILITKDKKLDIKDFECNNTKKIYDTLKFAFREDLELSSEGVLNKFVDLFSRNKIVTTDEFKRKDVPLNTIKGMVETITERSFDIERKIKKEVDVKMEVKTDVKNKVDVKAEKDEVKIPVHNVEPGIVVNKKDELLMRKSRVLMYYNQFKEIHKKDTIVSINAYMDYLKHMANFVYPEIKDDKRIVDILEKDLKPIKSNNEFSLAYRHSQMVQLAIVIANKLDRDYFELCKLIGKPWTVDNKIDVTLPIYLDNDEELIF